MAFWPRDERPKLRDTSKPNEKAKELRREYPYIEPGLTGAATLSAETLKWTFLSDPRSPNKDCIQKRLKFGKHAEIFPATRPPPMKPVRTSIKQRAEQGANFLRTYHPDVDITSELIRDQLMEDIGISRELERFDPHLGNLLEVFRPDADPSEFHLLFPTGENNCNLSVCSVNSHDSSRVVFEPRATPLCAFPTPIQQLNFSNDGPCRYLAVRTFGRLSVIGLKVRDDSNALTGKNLASLLRSNTAEETLVDMKISNSSTDLLVVGNKGSLFECSIEHGVKVTQIYQSDEPSQARAVTADFWRLALDKNPFILFIMSDKDIIQHDNRTKSSNPIYAMESGKYLLTSFENIQQEHILQSCSTSNLLWFDLRYPGKPLLAYGHGREFDQYLSSTTILAAAQRPLTFLTTRSNALVTVYDVSQSSQDLIHLHQPPYSVSSSQSLYETHTGQQFISDDAGLAVVRLSERGTVTFNEVQTSDAQEERAFVVHKGDEIEALEAASANLEFSASSVDAQKFTEVDLQETYDALFKENFEGKKEMELQTEKSLNQLLEFFPHYMRNHELPIEHMLTTYDIAFRSGDEPEQKSRADFLTESALHSQKAYEAMRDGKLSPQLVKAPWHRSIAPTLRRLDKDFRSDPKELMERLQDLNVADDAEDVNPYRELEKAACQHLALDLALSSDIFSETPFAKPSDPNTSLETMTGALSLGGEPPPIEFGYLQPVEKFNTAQEATAAEQTEVPLGVRLLLKEWDTGNPDEYVYRDPYHVTTTASPTIPRRTAAATQLRDFVDQRQRPPRIVFSALPQPAAESTRSMIQTVQSQQLYTMPPLQSQLTGGGEAGSSQDAAVSTQIVPGPFGGRPNVKKKPAKKRLGGF